MGQCCPKESNGKEQDNQLDNQYHRLNEIMNENDGSDADLNSIAIQLLLLLKLGQAEEFIMVALSNPVTTNPHFFGRWQSPQTGETICMVVSQLANINLLKFVFETLQVRFCVEILIVREISRFF